MRSQSARLRSLVQPSTSANVQDDRSGASSPASPTSPTFTTRVAKQNARTTNASSGAHRGAARDPAYPVMIPEMEAIQVNVEYPVIKKYSEPSTSAISPEDLLELQKSLEDYAARRMKMLKEAEGNLTFIKTGEYPVDDLKTRRVPKVKYSNRLKRNDQCPNLELLKHEKLELPRGVFSSEDEDEGRDAFYNVPQQFWPWTRGCMDRVDNKTLKAFKQTILDQYKEDAMGEYFVNEPFKYRRREVCIASPTPRSRKGVGRTNGAVMRSPVRRRVSTENVVAITEDNYAPQRNWRSPLTVNLADTEKTSEELSSMMQTALTGILPKGNVPPVAGNDCEVLGVVKTPKKDRLKDVVDANGVSSFNGDATDKHAFADNRLNGFSTPINGHTADANDLHGPPSLLNGIHQNGSHSPVGKRSGPKKLSEAAKTGSSHNSAAAGATDSANTHVVAHSELLTGLLESLVKQKTLSPTAHRLAKKKLRGQYNPPRRLLVSMEGRDMREDQADLDSVSKELLEKQKQLAHLEAQTKPLVTDIFERFKGEYALWRTGQKLEKAERALFEVAEKGSHLPSSWTEGIKRESDAKMKQYTEALREYNGLGLEQQAVVNAPPLPAPTSSKAKRQRR